MEEEPPEQPRLATLLATIWQHGPARIAVALPGGRPHGRVQQRQLAASGSFSSGQAARVHPRPGHRGRGRAKASQVDYLLMRLKQGLIAVPPGVRVVDFIRHDGDPPARPGSARQPRRKLDPRRPPRPLPRHPRERLARGPHDQGHPPPLRPPDPCPRRGVPDPEPEAGRHAGVRRPAGQGEGSARPAAPDHDQEGGRHAPHGVEVGRADGDRRRGSCPVDGLRYAKGDEKPRFQSRAEIERQLPGLPQEKASELWEVLYLTFDEVGRLLDHIKATAGHPWIYPLLATAAHTGATPRRTAADAGRRPGPRGGRGEHPRAQAGPREPDDPAGAAVDRRWRPS